MVRNLLPILAAFGLVASPVAARGIERGAAPAEDESSIAANPWIPLLVGLAVAIAIAFVIFDDDDDDDAVSA